jgi:hypothetical protein
MGRPSIDPEPMIRMLIIGYGTGRGLRARRRSCQSMGRPPIRLLHRRLARTRLLFAYSTNDLIDLEHAVIVDVEATTAIRRPRL